MNRFEGQVVTRENTSAGKLDRGVHHWFSRPAITGAEGPSPVGVVVGSAEGHDLHVHRDMDEVTYILSGRAEQWIEEEKKILESGESVFVPKKMVHATFNAGTEPLQFLAILGPGADLEGSMVDVSDQEPWKNLKK